jgi:hypothetical protein
MQRRTLLSSIGAGTLSLAGCTTQLDTVGSDSRTDRNTNFPEDCPISQGISVILPENLDASSVEAFVEEYESVYYREIVVNYSRESRLESYELSGSVTTPPERGRRRVGTRILGRRWNIQADPAVEGHHISPTRWNRPGSGE